MNNKEINHRKHFEEGPKKRGPVARPRHDKYSQLVQNLSANYRDGIRLELGCGTGRLAGLFQKYLGLTIAFRELSHIRQNNPGSLLLCANAEKMPIQNRAVTMIFEHAFLEHVFLPEHVLRECIRIIQSGGVIIHDTAWNVRPWAANSATYKNWDECNTRQKLFKITIAVRNSLVFRCAYTLPLRLLREAKHLFHYNLSLEYRELTPNFDLRIGNDEDACSSIDPHALIMFYRTHGLETSGFLRRLFFRTGPVIVKFPEDRQ